MGGGKPRKLSWSPQSGVGFFDVIFEALQTFIVEDVESWAETAGSKVLAQLCEGTQEFRFTS